MIVSRQRKIQWRAGVPWVTVTGQSAPVKALLQPGDAQPKLRKTGGRPFVTAGLSLAPHRSSGIGNLCPHASAGCAAACLDHQGMAGVWESIRAARIRKTVVWFQARKWFLDQLSTELQSAMDGAKSAGKRLACRLNVYSDLPWEKYGIVENFPDVEFYDYTKNPPRAGQLASNYWVTFSRSESNESNCVDILRRGANVATVYDDGYTTGGRNLHGNGPYRMPSKWIGFRTISGDDTDLRFLDDRRRVVMLKLKARTMAERIAAIDSGFAIQGVRS